MSDELTTTEERTLMLRELGEKARRAAALMAFMKSDKKNRVLIRMAETLRAQSDVILDKNALDVETARRNGREKAYIDRMTLTPGRINDFAKGLEDLVALKDPVGEIIRGWKGAQDIQITKVRVPIGVVGMIYEARPNVTVDAAGICFKTGNAVILRGSSDALMLSSSRR